MKYSTINELPHTLIALTCVVMLASAAACADAGSEDDEPIASEAESESESESGTETEDYAGAYDCVDSELMEGRPLVGPGYNPEQGLIGEPQDSYVVHSTQILVNPDEEEAFSEHGNAVVADLESREGLVAYSLAVEPTCGFRRTLGIWRSTEAMYDFVFGPVHTAAMADSFDITLTGKVTHWEVSADELPVNWWEEAMAHLDEVPISSFY